jgi:hypothetical protein
MHIISVHISKIIIDNSFPIYFHLYVPNGWFPIKICICLLFPHPIYIPHHRNPLTLPTHCHDLGHGAWIRYWIYWRTSTHHLELQVITAPLLISTIHRSLQHSLSLFPACCVYNSHSLATAFDSGDSSASRFYVVTVRRISRNWTLDDCQISYRAISFQSPLQSSTQLPILSSILSFTNYFTSLHFAHSTSLHWTALSWPGVLAV